MFSAPCDTPCRAADNSSFSRPFSSPAAASEYPLAPSCMGRFRYLPFMQQINRACKEIIMTVINRIASHLLFKENCECRRSSRRTTNFRVLSVRLEACKCNLVNVIMDCWWWWELWIGDERRGDDVVYRTILHIYWLYLRLLSLRCHNDNSTNSRKPHFAQCGNVDSMPASPAGESINSTL